MRVIRLIYFFLTLCLLSRIAAPQKTALDNPITIELYRNFRKWIGQIAGRTGREERLIQRAKNQNRVQNYQQDDFPCNVSMGRSLEIPESVNQLRPGDIDVIGAIGDSLTAGAGIVASTLLQVSVENRGIAFAGGGQSTWREYLTIPNILKEFNPNLYGFAVTDAFTFEKESQFNVGEVGAMSKDMPYMTRALINRMKSDPRVNIQKHWKLITLMIGANDFCTDMCYLPEAKMTLDNHEHDLLQVLRSIRDELPRTLVSILPPPHLKVLVDINARTLQCDITVNFECPCLFGLTYRSQRDEFYDIMSRWQQLEEEIARYPEFQRDDFAVVVQAFTTRLIFPVTSSGLTDMTFLSTDCFHLSQKANARAANALWNNMMEPVGNKSTNWSDAFEKIVCPTEEKPYIATLKNSKAL